MPNASALHRFSKVLFKVFSDMTVSTELNSLALANEFSSVDK